MITHALLDSKIKWWKVLLLPFFPLIWLVYLILYWITPPIYRPGIHCIVNETGSGKTLTAHMISKRFKRKKWRVKSNSAFNDDVALKNKHTGKILYDEQGKKRPTLNILYHFDNFKYKNLLQNCVPIFDEIQRDFNKRQNRQNDYNKVFIPFVEWLATHRHENCPWVYFLTQSPGRLDCQLFELMHNFHFVNADKRPIMIAWLKHKKLRPLIAPVRVHIISRRKKDIFNKADKNYMSADETIKTQAKRGKLKYKKIKGYRITIKPRDLADFDTFAFKTHKTIHQKDDTEPGETVLNEKDTAKIDV